MIRNDHGQTTFWSDLIQFSCVWGLRLGGAELGSVGLPEVLEGKEGEVGIIKKSWRTKINFGYMYTSEKWGTHGTWSDSSESLVLPPWTTLARPELWSSCGQCLSFWSSCWVPCKSERVSPGEHRENVEKTSPSEIFLILLTLLVLIYPDYWIILVIMSSMFLQIFLLSI